MSSAADKPYEALADQIEHELQLAGEGSFAELVQAQSAGAELIATLPDEPPASAGEVLKRASILHKRLEVELLRGREALLLELATLERARRTARGYAPPRRAPRIFESA
jgi:hypothetical protein